MNNFNEKLGLIPTPQEVTVLDGFFSFKGKIATEIDFNCENEFETFKSQIEHFSDNVIFENTNAYLKKIQIELKSFDGKSCYTLTIGKDSIKINASSTDNIYYALQTLRQLILSHREELPCCEIKDYPRFEWRGVMLDTARNFFSVDFIKKLIDTASLHKLNRFHWHLTDDQGWRFEVPGYENLITKGSTSHDLRFKECDRPRVPKYYTDEQIKDVVDFAAKRHIIVIPEVETPGHSSAILASYPELGCTGGPYDVEGHFGIFEDVLCAGNDDIFELLEASIKKLASIFPGPYLHIGGDECPHTRWEKCPKCQQRMKELNLSNVKQLQSWITSKVVQIVQKYGKIPIGWDEVLDNTEMFPLSKDAIVQSWRGAEGGIKAGSLGHKTIMSPTTDGCYLDYPHQNDGQEPGLQSCTTVKKSYEYNPIPKDYPKDKEDLILGGQGNLWTELVNSSRWAEYMLFPRLCAISESLWLNSESKDFDSFAKRLEIHKKRLDALDILYYKGKLD